MKLLWFLAYVLLGLGAGAWLLHTPPQSFHGILYYPQILLSGQLVLIAIIINMCGGGGGTPTKPV